MTVYAPLPGLLGVDYSNTLVQYQGGIKLLTLFESLTPYNQILKEYATVRGAGASARAGFLGPSVVGHGTGESINLATNAGKIFPTLNRTTVCFIRRKVDTTLRNANIFWDNDTHAVNLHCPYSDGTIYWDYPTAGRYSVSGQSFDTALDSYIFIAGPKKGREIWRRGQKIGANASITNSITTLASTNNLVLWGLSSDAEEMYYLAIFDAEWTDSMCRAWFADPYQVLAKPQELWFPLSAGTTVAPAKGAVTKTGQVPSIVQPITVGPAKGAVTKAGQIPGIIQAITVAPSKGAVLKSGNIPSIAQAITVSPIKGAVTKAGQIPTLAQTESVNVAPVAGHAVKTGYIPEISGFTPAQTGGGAGREDHWTRRRKVTEAQIRKAKEDEVRAILREIESEAPKLVKAVREKLATAKPRQSQEIISRYATRIAEAAQALEAREAEEEEILLMWML